MGQITNFPDGVNITNGLTTDNFTVTNNSTYAGNVSVGGNFDVTGDVGITGSTTFSSNIQVNGQSTFSNAVRLIGATLYASLINASSDFEVITSINNTAKLIIPNTTTGGVNLLGRTDGNFGSAGFVGEVIESTVLQGDAISLTNGVSANVTSISLTPGVWSYSGMVVFSAAGGNIVLYASVIASSETGELGFNEGIFAASATAGLGVVSVPTPTRYVTITTNTTIYLTALGNFSSGSMSAYGSIKAVRIC